jgi:MoaA/NifB/PqqE/SkfB family radical SAM enzyme
MNELSLHITDRCNLRCRFCLFGTSLGRGAERIPWRELERFLLDHKDQGYDRVNLHGGEPTLRRDLFDLLDLIRNSGYPAVSIQTNGRTLANRGFTERLYRAGVDLFILSVHGHVPALHDELAGVPGTLDRLLTGMDHVRELGGSLRTNTVAMRQNYAALPAIAELVTEHGAAHVNVSSLMPMDNGWGDLLPTFTALFPAVRKAVETAEARGATVSLEGFPLCTVPGLEERCLLRVAARGHRIKCLVRGNVVDDHDAYVVEHCKKKEAACQSCRWNDQCGGFYTRYVETHGWGELQVAPGN